MQTRRRVALLLDTSRGWDAGLTRGVARYCNLHEPWEFIRPAVTSYQHFAGHRLSIDHPEETLRALLKQRAQGVLLHESPLAAKLRRRGVATLIVPLGPVTTDGCYVTCDNRGAGRMAAEHLLELGVRSFAYLGFERTHWSDMRLAAYGDTLSERGYAIEVHTVPLHPAESVKPQLHRGLAAWLDAIPKPCGLFVGNDDLARAVIETCQTLGIRVPDKVAVVGVDNDELICELSSPPLTSIPFAVEKAGYEAAQMLEQVMNGVALDNNYIEAAVLPIAVRRSTDYVAIRDREVAAALRFIRDNAGTSIRVRDVVESNTLTHRTLHKRFTREVGHSLVKEINRRRAQFIAGLLTETTLSLGQIAARMDFPSDAHLVRFFRREYGETPGAYRRRLT